jgi:hypothetical protein
VLVASHGDVTPLTPPPPQNDDAITACGFATQWDPNAAHFYCTSAGSVSDAACGCKPLDDGAWMSEACGDQCLTDL